MFIAIYPTGAQAPGDANRVKESWAGPWNSLDKMIQDTGYYAKVRGTKATFAETIDSLQEQVRNTTSSLKKRELRHKIACIRELQGIK